MSSKQTKSASVGGSSKLSKESQKKQQQQQQQQLQEKPPTARKPSVDKPRSGTSSLPSSPMSSPKTSVAVSSSSSSRRAASPLARSGTASLPSSPLLNNPKASATAKKMASPNLAKKDAVKAKVAKLNEKKVSVDKGSGRSSAGGCGVERTTGDLNVGGATAGALDSERSSPLPKVVSPIRSNRPRGAESGTFARRQPPPPVEVEVKVERPVVSPRSRKIQESSSHFLEVKKREIGDQKEMENFVADQLQKVQVNLRQVDEISSKIGRCHDQINVETDQLSHLIGRSLALIRDLDGTLATVRDRVVEFMDRAENGALELDTALKTVVSNLCNYAAVNGGGGVHPDGPEDDSGKNGKPPGGSGLGSHSKVDEPGDNPKGDRSGEDTRNRKSGDGAVDRPPVDEKLEDCSRDHSIAGDYAQSEKLGDESGDQVQTFKSQEFEDLINGYLTKELVQNDALGVGLDAKGPEYNLENGKPGGENVYYTQISKPLQGYAGHSQRGNESLAKSTGKFVTKPYICGNEGLFDLEVLAVIENVFEDPSNMQVEDIRHSVNVIWSALADTLLQKQVARGTFTKEMVEELLMIITVYLSQKQFEFENVSGLGGVEEASCILSPNSEVRKSLDGLEIMNGLISLLSPIKSNASNAISDCASKTDAVVCNEANEEHLSDGKSIVYLSQKPSEDVDVSCLGVVEKASCIISPNSDVRKSLDGLEIMNGLISLLSPIKSNASKALSDCASKTDAVVSDEANKEHLSEEKSIVNLSQKPSEDVDMSCLGGEKASCIISPNSDVRKSLDGLEIMNGLISLLSPIKSNASNAISDYATNTDAVVCNGKTDEHLGEGKSDIQGSDKVEPTEIKEEQGLETEGPAEIKEKQVLETNGPAEIKEKQGLETEGPVEIKEEQGLETEGSAEIKEEQGLETEGSAEIKKEQVLETEGPAEMEEYI